MTPPKRKYPSRAGIRKSKRSRLASKACDSVCSSGCAVNEKIMGRVNEQRNENKLYQEQRPSNNFDLIKVLGSGGFGSVFKVKHKVDDKIYAVKIVEFTRQADCEVKALARCDHDNIVQYYTCWPESVHMGELSNTNASGSIQPSASECSLPSSNAEYISSSSAVSEMDISACSKTGNPEPPVHSSSEDFSESLVSKMDVSGSSKSSTSDQSMQPPRRYLYIQMEYCEGGTLHTWINDRNAGKTQRTRDDALSIFTQIVSGVEYIHSKQLIHRDLKPENIFFASDDEVKLGDFGLVTTMNSEIKNTPNCRDTLRTVGKGTMSYMSPEQMTSGTYDEKTDIFPLGLICFELLWRMTTTHGKEMMFMKLREQKFPVDFSQKFPSEQKLISGLLGKDPSLRPDASQIREKLKLFVSNQSCVLPNSCPM